MSSQKPAGNVVASQAVTTTSTGKKEPIQDAFETQTGSQPYLLNLNSGQTFPKKKGGFMITSVKDSVDGDESADDLDESHASYSDVSYSRATDVDHEQESSPSEDTLNMTMLDGLSTSGVHGGMQASTQQDLVQKGDENQTITQNAMNSLGSKVRLQAGETMSNAGSLSSVNSDSPQDLPSDIPPTDVTATQVFPASVTSVAEVPSGSIPAKSGLPNQLASSKTTNKSVNAPSTSVPTSSVTAITTTTMSTTTTTTHTAAPKSGASRVYKVVKREAAQPVRRDSARWISYDFSDTQTPNLGYMTTSSSDCRSQFHDQSLIHMPGQLSMSATSVPSSASAYSLQHSDSASSVQRDIYLHGISTSSTVQHSASTSSVNHDLNPRKVHQGKKPVNELSDVTGKAQQYGDDRLSGESISEQDAFKTAMQSYDATNHTEHEEDSASPNVRIDNKIEAAMDLVKKHLMSAVRDEVDELKERITELQKENDALRGILTADQMASVTSFLHTSSAKSLPSQKSTGSQSLQIYNQQPNASLPSLPPTLDVAVTSQSLSLHSQSTTGHQSLLQKQSLPANPLGFAAASNQRGIANSIPSLGKPLGAGSLSIAPNPQLSHQQQSNTGQQLVQQQSGLQQQQPSVARPMTYQQNHQPVYQQGQQQPKRQQPYPATASQVQVGYPSQQPVMQPPGLVAQQPQPSHFQQMHQQQPPPPQGQLQTPGIPQQSAVVQNPGQHLQTSQGNAVRLPAQASQSVPVIQRQQQLPISTVVTSSNISQSTTHPHNGTVTTLPNAHYQPASVPPPSACAPPVGGSLPNDTKFLQL